MATPICRRLDAHLVLSDTAQRGEEAAQRVRHTWIVFEDSPAFVRYEGPMYSGPVWRIDMASPPWTR